MRLTKEQQEALDKVLQDPELLEIVRKAVDAQDKARTEKARAERGLILKGRTEASLVQKVRPAPNSTYERLKQFGSQLPKTPVAKAQQTPPSTQALLGFVGGQPPRTPMTKTQQPTSVQALLGFTGDREGR